jgi:uncharacterized membrane protein YqjE
MEDDVMNQVKAAGTAARERSTGELVKEVAEQVSVLVRDELKLAQLELAGKGKRAGTGIGMMGGGGLIALYGVACLIACVVIALSHAITAWLAALIIGAALLAAAALVALAGRARLRKAAPPVPEEAVDGIKADVQQVREGARR